MQDAEGAQSDLQKKVASWLSTEGYPTEFQTASIFRRHGFRVFQGHHVRNADDGTPREIDVLAHMDHAIAERPLIRCEFVVECKWSGKKPWVMFASKSARMAASACISQTISSTFGTAVMWHLAGDAECKNMAIFRTPTEPGFGGRQAFSKGQDVFYSALNTVTSAATHRMRQYDKLRKPGTLPRFCVVTFPIVVVDGELFEATFSEEVGGIQVMPAESARCHWTGAPEWKLHSSIDVVTLRGLHTFLEMRKPQIVRLLELMNDAAREISDCYSAKSIDKLKIKSGSRGIVGLPGLLQEIVSS